MEKHDIFEIPELSTNLRTLPRNTTEKIWNSFNAITLLSVKIFFSNQKILFCCRICGFVSLFISLYYVR